MNGRKVLGTAGKAAIGLANEIAVGGVLIAWAEAKSVQAGGTTIRAVRAAIEKVGRRGPYFTL